MRRQIIGISANNILDSGEMLYHLPISYTPDGYVKAVQKAGGLPLVLPVGTKDLAKDYISQVDKLILTGGQDVLPKFYKQAKTVQGNYSEARDRFELALLEEALLQKKAGICGMSWNAVNECIFRWRFKTRIILFY